MTVKRIEGLSYAVIGAGYGIIGAILIGVGTTVSLAGQPQALEKFENVFWSKTLPWVVVVGLGVAPAAHCTIVGLRKNHLSQSSNLDDRAYQPSYQQDQPATNHRPTYQPPQTNLPPTNRLLVAPNPQANEVALPSQMPQATNQNKETNGDQYRKDLEMMISGDSSFGN